VPGTENPGKRNDKADENEAGSVLHASIAWVYGPAFFFVGVNTRRKMPTSLNARFTADFSQLEQAVAAAEVNIQVFEKAANRASAELGKLSSSYSGANIQRDLLLATTAVERTGGVTKLTAAEQSKLNALVTEGIAKYR